MIFSATFNVSDANAIGLSSTFSITCKSLLQDRTQKNHEFVSLVSPDFSELTQCPMKPFVLSFYRGEDLDPVKRA